MIPRKLGGHRFVRQAGRAALALGAALGAGSAPAQEAGAGNPFIDDAKAGLMFRTSYFDRRSAGAQPASDEPIPTPTSAAKAFRQQAAGIGGWLYGNTGELANMLSFAGSYNFTEPWYGPEKYPYNYILRDPDQKSVSTIGEANARLRLGGKAPKDNGATIVVGRQTIKQAWYLEDVVRFYNKLDQSMIGPRDVRAMQWINYEAATIQGRLAEGTLRYYGGYAWEARQINDNEFRNLYQAAYQTTVWPDNRKTGDSAGASYAGLQYKPSRDMMVEGSFYVFQNMMNNAYVDFDYVFRLENKNYVRLGTQYMYQEGNGDNLVSGGRDFNTGYWGIYAEARFVPWFVPYGMAGITRDGDEIRSPYSIGPSYLVQRIGENSKAGEKTWIVGGIIDFESFHEGLRGLQFDINYGHRFGRHLAGEDDQKLTNWDELATDLIYIFPQDGFFKNLRTRLRYAHVVEEGSNYNASMGRNVSGEKHTDDIRFDIGLNIPFTK